MHRFTIPVLRALTSVLNSAARWAGEHQRAILEIWLMIAAAAVVATGSALVYIVYLIRQIDRLI
jgi:hypothetical protein